MQPICTVFRNLKHIRHVRIAAEIIEGSGHELVLEMLLSNGITRCFRFVYSDCEIVNALFEEDSSTSCVTAKPKIFTQVTVVCFHTFNTGLIFLSLAMCPPPRTSWHSL